MKHPACPHCGFVYTNTNPEDTHSCAGLLILAERKRTILLLRETAERGRAANIAGSTMLGYLAHAMETHPRPATNDQTIRTEVLHKAADWIEKNRHGPPHADCCDCGCRSTAGVHKPDCAGTNLAKALRALVVDELAREP